MIIQNLFKGVHMADTRCTFSHLLRRFCRNHSWLLCIPNNCLRHGSWASSLMQVAWVHHEGKLRASRTIRLYIPMQICPLVRSSRGYLQNITELRLDCLAMCTGAVHAQIIQSQLKSVGVRNDSIVSHSVMFVSADAHSPRPSGKEGVYAVGKHVYKCTS